MTPEQFLVMARVLPEPMFLIYSTGEILAANLATTNVLGFNNNELVDKKLSDIVITPAKKVNSYIRACSSTKEMVIGALTFRTKSEAILECRCEGAAIKPWLPDSPALIILRFKSKTVTVSKFTELNKKIDNLGKEILGRKRLEEELEKANKVKDTIITELQTLQQELVMMEALVESSHDPILVLTLDAIILRCNTSTQNLYGYSDKEICGRHISLFFPTEYTNAIPKLLLPVNRGESVHDFETINLNKTGNFLQVSITAFPIKNKAGEIINASVIVRDLTERKYLERERAKLLKIEH